MIELKKLPFLGGALVVAATTACAVDAGDGGTFPNPDQDDLVTVDREHPPFLAIENNADIRVIVHQREEQEVLVTCDNELVNSIATFVDAGTDILQIELPRTLEVQDSCMVEIWASNINRLDNAYQGVITAPEGLSFLSEVRNRASGAIRVEGVDTRNLDVRNEEIGSILLSGISAETVDALQTGSGTIELAGEADVVALTNYADGLIDAGELVAERAFVRNDDDGEIIVNATGSIDAEVTGSGDVRVLGDPADRNLDDQGEGGIVFE